MRKDETDYSEELVGGLELMKPQWQIPLIFMPNHQRKGHRVQIVCRAERGAQRTLLVSHTTVTMCLAIILTLTACGGLTDEYDQHFATYEELHEHYRISNTKILEKIEPLPEPIAESALIILPTRQEFVEAIRPWVKPKYLQDNAKNLEETALMLPRYVEARNLVRRIELVQGLENKVTPPSNGFTVLYRFVGRDGVHIFVQGEGQLKTSELSRPWYRSLSYEIGELGKLNVIEEFVRSWRRA